MYKGAVPEIRVSFNFFGALSSAQDTKFLQNRAFPDFFGNALFYKVVRPYYLVSSVFVILKVSHSGRRLNGLFGVESYLVMR